MHPAYRPDIDGLRAVAVLGVLLYHYGALWLPGGFTGVDVFFVISGYLITRNLRTEMEAGRFSLMRFYGGRMRRILPASITTIGVTLAAGYFLLWPADYAALGSSAVYASAGLANLFFFWNTGYFDQQSELQPLLHFWSLGVEEQFYLVWPILMLAATAFIKSRRLLAGLLGAVVLGGLAHSAYVVGSDPKAAFYLPHPRAWELALGALLVFLPAVSHNFVSHAMSWFGLALVAASFLFIKASDPFPGLNAAYACCGAALLIWPKARTLPAAALSIAPAVGIGLISYSLYLWHWPIIVVYRHYSNGFPPGPAEGLALAILTFAVAIACWRFIELPFRRMAVPAGRSVAMGLGLIAIVILFSTAVVQTSGFPARVPTSLKALTDLDEMWDWPCPETVTLEGVGFCGFGAPWAGSTQKVLLWGDSHAEHLVPIIDAGAGSASVILHRGCIPFVGLGVSHPMGSNPNYAQFCRDDTANLLRILGLHPEITSVVLAGSWESRIETAYVDGDAEITGIPAFRKGMEEIISVLLELGIKVFLVADTPPLPVMSPACGEEFTLPLRAHCDAEAAGLLSVEYASRRQAENATMADLSEANVVFLPPALCKGARCQTVLAGHSLYRDNGHLRRNMPAHVYEQLFELMGLSVIFTE